MSKGNPKEPKTYALKLGQSFDKRSEVSYHTMRFDFKPVSLGSSKDLTMNIGGENGSEVIATITGKQGNTSSQSSQSVFKGSKQPYTAKECVLVVDEVTGEVTLERLGEKVMLKRARPERAEGKSGQGRAPSDKMDISPSSTPDYSPLGSSSPTPSPSQPVNLLHSQPSTSNSKTNQTAAKVDPRPAVKISAVPISAHQPPKPLVIEKAKLPPQDIVPEIGEISASSSSSSSGSDSSSSDSENDMDDLLESVTAPLATKPVVTSTVYAASNKPQTVVNTTLPDQLRTTSDEEGSDDDDFLKF